MMMKPLRQILAGASLCALMIVNASAADALQAPPEPLLTAAQTWMQRTHVPGLSMAGVRDGELVWQAHLGEAAPGRDIDEQTLFNVASLTKPLFALLSLKLIAADTFGLDTPLAEYWVDPQAADDPRHKELTARLALSHQTGLPNWRGDQPLAFRFEPGTGHEYSGEGYEYLRRALEAASGETMPALMAQTITGPLNMGDTYFGWQPEIADRIAVGFNEAAEAMDMLYLRDRGHNAAASTFTTAADYARFAAWVSRGAGLPERLFDDMRRPQARFENPIEFFGLGWKLVRLEDETVLMHDGREPGVRSLVLVRPKTGRAFVLLSNSSNTEAMFRPMIEAAFADGKRIMARIDRDTWRYLQAMPAQQQGGMVAFIARSPAFTQKLLHAAHQGLMVEAGLSEQELAEAQAAISEITQGALAGRLDAEQLKRLLAGLMSEQGGLLSELTVEQAADWLTALQQLAASAQGKAR